uniref:RecF/RecN/SMC N-terminal domain-containing protein n=1 Tax=Cucumis melo TaxID=3656 RepID=A0A9I9DEZ5_CUCME
MSQDKSREFLHSGNDKDKFKATLLQQVDDLLKNIFDHLRSANALVDDLESTIRPVEKELNELRGKIKNMEQVEEISQQVQQLKKKLAWSWVYDVDKQLQEQSAKIGKLQDRIPICRAKIDHQLGLAEKLRERYIEKKTQIASMMERTSEVRRMKDELQETLTLATREKLGLEEEHGRKINYIQKMAKRVRLLEQQVQDIHEQHIRNTQAEESEIEEKLKELELETEAAKSTVMRKDCIVSYLINRLKDEENALMESLYSGRNEIKKIAEEIASYEKKAYEFSHSIQELKQHQTNKVTAFGGDKVIQLLRAIERHHQRFKKPPIGPIGSHLSLSYGLASLIINVFQIWCATEVLLSPGDCSFRWQQLSTNLVNGDMWAPAVEIAIGRLLNAFIVTDHQDSLLLRRCANEANYRQLPIVIYDFSRPVLNIPAHMLPQTKHPTTLSVIHSENHTVVNVLIDKGDAERQVLVKDYNVGKSVAFDQRISNLKEVFTLDGYKMFSRGSVQTILPPVRKPRSGRLCSSFDDQIKSLEKDALNVKQEAEQCRKRKRASEEQLRDLEDNLNNAKRRCRSAERSLMSKNLELQDLRKSQVAETSSVPSSNVDELHQEISKIEEEIQENKMLLEKFKVRMKEAEAKAKDLKVSFENLCESAKGEIDAFEEAERDMLELERKLHSAEKEKDHYESIMTNKVLFDIKEAERQHQELERHRKESYNKASIICPESEIEALGDWDGSTPEQLSAQLTRLNQRLNNETRRCSESLEDLRMMYEKKERTIIRKQLTYKSFREKLDACQKALQLRRNKFERNASLLKRQLTWQFNGHLRKKGISGHIKVNYEEKTLSVEVKMPQDASSSSVRDTRGLSGGERSFSTLCFALALHEMTEAPFRAMDEFDVFMDAVSRKISLDTLVDFALAQGSQWIFITPHDIGMVKQGERIKKQQMAAPRS